MLVKDNSLWDTLRQATKFNLPIKYVIPTGIGKHVVISGLVKSERIL